MQLLAVFVETPESWWTAQSWASLPWGAAGAYVVLASPRMPNSPDGGCPLRAKLTFVSKKLGKGF